MTFSEAAMIMMSGGNSGIIKSLLVTENGVYEAPDGIDGYNPINVKVPNRYEEGLTDGRKSLLDFEDGKAPPKEVEMPSGTLIIDNALDEADDDLALSIAMKYDQYASGKVERFPNRIYSISVEPYHDESLGTTYEWIMGHFTEIGSDGTAKYHHKGIISSRTFASNNKTSWFKSVGYDPDTNKMILVIDRIEEDGTIKEINTSWNADVNGIYFKALTNGATVGGLPHT